METSSFEDFRPISCFNINYKLISKIIANHLKPILRELISKEQFGFLFKRQVHDAVSLAQESFHTIKTKNVPSFVLKLVLSKEYDKVNWNFMRLFLIKLE